MYIIQFVYEGGTLTKGRLAIFGVPQELFLGPLLLLYHHFKYTIYRAQALVRIRHKFLETIER